jgi:hypothetical protein
MIDRLSTVIPNLLAGPRYSGGYYDAHGKNGKAPFERSLNCNRTAEKGSVLAGTRQIH